MNCSLLTWNWISSTDKNLLRRINNKQVPSFCGNIYKGSKRLQPEKPSVFNLFIGPQSCCWRRDGGREAEYYTILIGCCRCAWLSSLLTYEDIFACLVEEKPNKLLAINTRKTRYGENWSAWCLQSPSIAKSTWDFGVSTQVKSPEFGILTFEASSSSQHVRSAQIALFYCAKWS